MAWRLVLGTWAALATGGAVWLATGGQLTGGQVVEGVAVLVALVALWGVVKVPWDLYFAARYVQRSQADGQARRIEVREEEVQETAWLSRRLLALALGLHLLGAGACAAVTWVAGGQLGWLASGAFLLTMLLRPATAMVSHVRQRLEVLKGRARVPTVDASSLKQQVDDLKARLGGMVARLDDDAVGLDAVASQVVAVEGALERGLDQQRRRHQSELDRLGLEMERALEKLTRDQEVLAGLRAFLQMVKEPRDARG